MKKKVLLEIIIAISLANLLFISGWRNILYISSRAFELTYSVSYLDYLSLIFLILTLAFIFLCGLCVSRYLNSGKTPRLVKWCFVLAFLCVLNAIRIAFFVDFQRYILGQINRTTFVVVLLIMGIIGVLIILKWGKTFRNYEENLFYFIRTLVLVFSPFIIITFSQSIWEVSKFESGIPKLPDRKQLEVKKVPNPNIKSRIVWVIFDELDYRMAFEKMPKDLELKEFDRLKEESLFATKAIPPAMRTYESIPSLFLGKKVKKSTLDESQEKNGFFYLEFFDNSKPAKFNELPNVFSRVKKMGADTGAVGWSNKYCKNFGEEYLSVCDLVNNGYQKGKRNEDGSYTIETETIAEITKRHFQDFVSSLPFVLRMIDLYKRNNDAHEKRHWHFLAESKRLAINPKIDLTFIHLPLPHFPYVYNSLEKKFSGGKSYRDNLVLSDVVLGEIRQAMENAGVWDDSTVIISSDHQWRIQSGGTYFKSFLTKDDYKISNGIEDKRVPFIVKLKNQKTAIEYEKPFNTIITHDLILALMKGEVSTPEDLKIWLDSKVSK